MGRYLEYVIAAVIDVLELTESVPIGPETRLEEDLGFDSGLYIELLMTLEDRISGFKIDPADLKFEDFVTVESTARYVCSIVPNE